MISRYDVGTEFWTSEGCFIVEMHNRGEDDGCSIARARVPAGGTTRLHSLKGTVERYVILSGTARIRAGGASPVEAGPMDVVTFRADETQTLVNPGQGDLVFLAICTPRFRQENYVDLGAAETAFGPA
jgi:mannose-6-phosphate isomerase-like protein (cupin superfamily)